MTSSHLSPLSFCPQSLPVSGSFPMSWLFACPKYWSFRISPSNEYSGLIFFRIDSFDLAVQETPKSLLQPHNAKAAILRHSVFLLVHLSHPYVTTEKTIALTICWKSDIFAFSLCCLGINMLSRLDGAEQFILNLWT